MTAADLLLTVVDLVIILGAVGLLFYIVVQPTLAPGLPGRGRHLILFGILLTVALHVTELALSIFTPAAMLSGNDGILDKNLPDWAYWLFSRAGLLLIMLGALYGVLLRRDVGRAIAASSRRMRQALDQAREAEDRYRSLLDTTSRSVACYTFEEPLPVKAPIDVQLEQIKEALLTECNHNFAKDLRFESPSDVVGTRFRFADITSDEGAFRGLHAAFFAGGYRLSEYECQFVNHAGKERVIRVSATGIVNDGKLQRFWCETTNIIDYHRARSALYRRRQFQELLASVSSRLVVSPSEDAASALTECVKEVGTFIGGNRATIIWVDWNRGVGEILYAWQSEHGRPVSDITMENFPYLSKCVASEQTICINDIAEVPPEAQEDIANLDGTGLQSFLMVPLKASGTVVGAFSIGNDESASDWGEQDELDARVFAELFANYVLRLRSRRELDDALDSLRKASDRLQAENVYLRDEIKLSHDFDEIVGESDAIRRCLQMVEQVADTMTPVLLLGETGTGKELVARALHEHSSRRHRPLVKVNCAALPANLIESELFGFQKGAFTGADVSKRGRFDLANESTLFLDEIAEIPLELQAKLLRVLQEGEFERLGDSKTIRVDVRILAATNRDLLKAVDAGEFRSDLFYRINMFPIELPPLREREGDIRLLAEHFASMHAKRLDRDVSAISARMMEQLNAYQWPGNVRELEGVIQRSLISSTGSVLELDKALFDIRDELDPALPNVIGESGFEDLRAIERRHIMTVLDECKWKISGTHGAAARLGIPPSTLRSKMKRLAIARPG